MQMLHTFFGPILAEFFFNISYVLKFYASFISDVVSFKQVGPDVGGLIAKCIFTLVVKSA